jgi:proteasome lid subunit RPN8/RPN11
MVGGGFSSRRQTAMMTLLKLSRPLYAQLRAHAEQSYPHECCGALLGALQGDDWSVCAIVRADNLSSDSAYSHYQISPEELVKIARQARESGLSIAGFYHSHPDHPALWSETDLGEAHWPGCSYVIIEVAQGRVGAVNSFRLLGAGEAEKRFVLEKIQLE